MQGSDSKARVGQARAAYVRSETLRFLIEVESIIEVRNKRSCASTCMYS